MRKVIKAIIYKNDKFLLQLRDNKNDIYYPNHWGFFGGEVDNSESHQETLIREIYEELNWKIHKYKYLCKTTDINSNCIILYFVVNFDYFISKLILSEGQIMKWFTSEEMISLTMTPTNILDLLNNKNLKKIMNSL